MARRRKTERGAQCLLRSVGLMRGQHRRRSNEATRQCFALAVGRERGEQPQFFWGKAANGLAPWSRAWQRRRSSGNAISSGDNVQRQRRPRWRFVAAARGGPRLRRQEAALRSSESGPRMRNAVAATGGGSAAWEGSAQVPTERGAWLGPDGSGGADGVRRGPGWTSAQERGGERKKRGRRRKRRVPQLTRLDRAAENGLIGAAGVLQQQIHGAMVPAVGLIGSNRFMAAEGVGFMGSRGSMARCSGRRWLLQSKRADSEL